MRPAVAPPDFPGREPGPAAESREEAVSWFSRTPARDRDERSRPEPADFGRRNQGFDEFRRPEPGFNGGPDLPRRSPQPSSLQDQDYEERGPREHGLPDRDSSPGRPAEPAPTPRPPRFDPPDYRDEGPGDFGAPRGFAGRPGFTESRAPWAEPQDPRDQRGFREPAGYQQPHDSGQRPAFGERDSFPDRPGYGERIEGQARAEEPSRFDREPRRQSPRFDEPRSHRPRLDETRSEEAVPDGAPFGASRFDETRMDGQRFDESRFDGPRFEETRFDGPRFDETRIEQPRSMPPRFTPGPDDAAIRREALPSSPPGTLARPDWSYRDPAGFQGGPGNGFPGPQREGLADDRGRGSFGMMGGPRGAGAFAPDGPAWDTAPPAEGKRGRRTPLLIGAGVLVVVIAAGAAVAAPKLLKHTDPGCSAYSTNALPAYNHAISALNSQASQQTLASDLATAITQLTGAEGQAQATTVRTALQGLLTELTQVQADVKKGAVPSATVTSLNTASSAADNACR